jgi:heme O synthase-like polyprenyltransferase
MSETSEVERLRRLSVVTAALTAALAIVPALTMSHGHLVLGFVCLGVQIVLLALSIRFFKQYKRLKVAQKD